MYAGSKYESHYTVWTAWISIRVRVRVRVYFILQNLAPLALPYMCAQPLELPLFTCSISICLVISINISTIYV